MPIDLSCSCGRRLRVRDELAGLAVKCPDCGDALAVPGGVTILEGPRSYEARDDVPPRPPRRYEDDFDEYEDDLDDRPRQKKKKKGQLYKEMYGTKKEGGFWTSNRILGAGAIFFGISSIGLWLVGLKYFEGSASTGAAFGAVFGLTTIFVGLYYLVIG